MQLRTKWLARLRSTVAVSTLIGLSWILGFFAMGEASFAINVAFALLNSLQVPNYHFYEVVKYINSFLTKYDFLLISENSFDGLCYKQ